MVDDSIRFLNAAARELRAGGFEVLTTTTGTQALELVAKECPAAVLLDIQLESKTMDGVECARRLRANGYDRPICMITGDSSAKMLLESALAGADDYMVKPSFKPLSAEVKRLIESETEASCKKDFDPIVTSGFLHSLGLSTKQVEFLAAFASHGFPAEKDLAVVLGMTEGAVWKRLSRIREKLGNKTSTQIASVLTALSAYRHGMSRPAGRSQTARR